MPEEEERSGGLQSASVEEREHLVLAQQILQHCIPLLLVTAILVS